MIGICPYCGRWLERPLLSGITTCDNCHRIFDSSPLNRLLSAAWACRRQHLLDASVIRENYLLEEGELALLQSYVIDGGCSHDEFLKLLATERLAYTSS